MRIQRQNYTIEPNANGLKKLCGCYFFHVKFSKDLINSSMHSTKEKNLASFLIWETLLSTIQNVFITRTVHSTKCTAVRVSNTCYAQKYTRCASVYSHAFCFSLNQLQNLSIDLNKTRQQKSVCSVRLGSVLPDE